MLNIEIVNEEKKQFKLKLWIERKEYSADPEYSYHPREIILKVEEFLKKHDKNICDLEFKNHIRILMNKMPAHRHEQELTVGYSTLSKKKIKKSNHKVKPGESSGSSKS